ncbi:hypothetical protein FOCC_FOCC001753 [Frankliniella occidentalis]|nr:hypothetical protein FOCC_FOCC001753 [Frankliniella occidentalis]
MGLCTRRHFVLTICILQLISTVERQVFDFLGTLWGPILANFFQIIFVIFGFFGTHQFRPKYVIAYSVWSALWIGWNIFIICFYLNIGVDKNGSSLNFGTGCVSWWEVNGFGCRPVYTTNITEDFSCGPRPESVSGCVLTYEYIEVLHAAIQIIFAVLGGSGAIHVLRIFVEEDDSFYFSYALLTFLEALKRKVLST